MEKDLGVENGVETRCCARVRDILVEDREARRGTTQCEQGCKQELESVDFCQHHCKLFQEPNLERDGKLWICTQMTEKGERKQLKYNIPGLIYAFGLPGPLLPTEYIYCAYSIFTLQNELHLSYFRSSGMVQGGFRPCFTKSFGNHVLPVSSQSLQWCIWASGFAH